MVNEWNKTALVAEFETMLQRRLRSGAAPVAACAGFDPDAASAYLEGALGGSHRADYESHLAGCVTCRHHLIKLARLAQCAPFAEAQPVPSPNRTPVWARWKESVAAWIDVSSRGFKWQIASATGAAFAILIAALGAQSWRQTPKDSANLIAGSAVPSNPVEPALQPVQSPAFESSPLNDPFSDSVAQETVAIRPERAQVSAPKPLVGPQGNDPKLSFDAPSKPLMESSNLQAEAPAAPGQTALVAQTAPDAQRLSAYLMAERSAEANKAAPRARLQDWEERAAVRSAKAEEGRDPVQILPQPQPRINPRKPIPPDPIVSRGGFSFMGKRQVESNPEPNSKSVIKEVKEALSSVTSIVKRPIKWPFSDSEPKPIQAEEAADAASQKPLEWPFRGKVFVYKKGMWIDKEYKSEMQEWRRWTLTRGSDEYKRVLAEEPQLKDFFAKGPILIVWKNRIYKVQ